MIYEYLIFNLLIITGPLLVFFWKKKGIVKPAIGPLFFGVFLTAIIFIVWDQLVVNYFWFFNSQYITGIFLLNLPIEEILFFITVPFSCLLLWVNYKRRFADRTLKYPLVYLWSVLAGASILFLVYGKIYSASVLFVFLIVVALDLILKTKLFYRKLFLIFIFLITNILTFIFNLYLTARPIVIYSEALKTNFNIISIPVEDFIFGMALIALNIILYEKIFSKKGDYLAEYKVD